MPGNELNRAARHFQRREFHKVIQLLQPRIYQYRENGSFYKLLGMSCLYEGDIEGADSYLNRSLQIKDEDLGCMLGMAVVHLHKNEAEESLNIWLRVLELDNKNVTARQGLSLLRRGLEPAEILGRSTREVKILPRVSRKPPYSLILILFVVAAGILSVFITRIVRGESLRPELENWNVTGTEWVQDGEGLRYTLTSREVKETVEKAKKLFNAYKDNLAVVELNRLLFSNASLEVKNLAQLLKGHVKTPHFGNLKNGYSYKSVISDPYLYQGGYVIWKGKIANLITTAETINFDFLVGYQDEVELEGIVPVIFRFAVDVADGDDLELLGKVITRNESVILEGVSVHKISPPGQ